MPEGKDLQRLLVERVVDEVANPAEIQAADRAQACARMLGADAGLLCEKRNGLPKVLADGSWRCWQGDSVAAQA